jgi:predicted PurR-regulated permease PerM
MPVFDTNQQRAAWLVAIIGALVVLGLLPYASGLLGAPVLYVIFAPLHRHLLTWTKSRAVSSGLVVAIAIVCVVVPLAWLVSLLVGQAQDAVTAILRSPVLNRIDALHVGPYDIGPQLRDAGSHLVSLAGGSVVSLLGSATKITLDALFAFFGLYYILIDPDRAWAGLRPYIPFSDSSVDQLRRRFTDVTMSMLIGSGMSALLQGATMALAFTLFGLENAVFWGAVVAVLALLPAVGSALVWIPAAVVLLFRDRPVAAVFLILWGSGIGALIDHVFRPYVSSRYAHIHPLLILIGAIVGVTYLGIVGLLLGPLILSYFFEILALYQKEYLPKSAPA